MCAGTHRNRGGSSGRKNGGHACGDFFPRFPLKQLNCLKAIFVFFWTVFFLDGFFNLPFSPAFVDELM